MKRAIRFVNDVFIVFLLAVFYFLAIGLGFLLQNLVARFNKQRKTGSYWQKDKPEKLGANHFSSPY
jgi:hypothetical protein